MTVQQAATRVARYADVRPAAPNLRIRLIAYLAASILLITPCFWQSRIQAGDLSSHIYNTWLASEIRQGKLPGLVVVGHWTNVLFDIVLSGLVRVVGYAPAQKIAVSAAVLLFFWSAFYFLKVVSRRERWDMVLPLAMLAYGWVFHMGFFNYYISAALSLAAVAACWRGSSARSFWAVPLLGLGTLAHFMPVAWAAGAIAYVCVIKRLRQHVRLAPFVVCCLALGAVSFVLTARFETRHSFRQVFAMTGADQTVVFGAKYGLICVGVLVFWFSLWRGLRKKFGYRRILGTPTFQLFALTAAVVLILPNAVLLAGYEHGLMYVTERTSLIIGVLVCALLARAGSTRWQRVWIACVALAFFAWNYRETAKANLMETRISAVVAELPSGARVVSSFQNEHSRVNLLAHAVDRACIGRCFSYGNYEPSSRQFRVRATGPNPYVVWQYSDSDAIQNGTYSVKPEDVPLYQLVWCNGGQDVCARKLFPGQMNGEGKR
ncbi:MAG TPA: hypothetical protein VD837_05740 [Terriglobales bacterium]|nr:hypothetical protein [Terriglobales bacterium]